MSVDRSNAASGAVRIFVYGTLLPGQSNYRLVEPYVMTSHPGRVRGKLADVGEYPAILLGQDGFVRGMWMDVALEGLPVLDELEGFGGIEESNDYERVWIADADRAELSGWIYVWTETRGYPFVDGDWWPDAADRRK